MGKHQCAATTIPRDRWGYFHPSQCQRKGILEHDGKWYCKQHFPPNVEARQNASYAKWCEKLDIETAERKALKTLPTRIAELEAALRELVDNCGRCTGAGWIIEVSTGNELPCPDCGKARALLEVSND